MKELKIRHCHACTVSTESDDRVLDDWSADRNIPIPLRVMMSLWQCKSGRTTPGQEHRLSPRLSSGARGVLMLEQGGLSSSKYTYSIEIIAST